METRSKSKSKSKKERIKKANKAYEHTLNKIIKKAELDAIKKKQVKFKHKEIFES